jgi:hypothetical protein
MIACLLKLVCSIMLIAGARTVSQELIIFISALGPMPSELGKNFYFCLFGVFMAEQLQKGTEK